MSFSPSSSALKPLNSPKLQAQLHDRALKRKKEKPHRVYVTTLVEEEEIEYDEVVKEVKKSTKTARVVKKKPSSEGKPNKNPRSKVE